MRTIQVTVTLSATVPAEWDAVPKAEVKERAETVSADTLRQVFRGMPGVVCVSTATVEGGPHD